MHPASDPVIEFLEYLTPGDGRPTPGDIRANDIAHWQTRLVARDLDILMTSLRTSGCTIVSAGPVNLPDTKLGFTKGLIVRDPDGHAMLIVNK